MGATSAWDQAGLEAQQRLLQRRQEAEQQRQEQQNTVGMRLLDSINSASNIKPQIKDPNTGELIDNPAYAQAQKDRADLMAQYSALNAPEQHASFGRHLHGLIFGHADHRPQQPALSPNSSPNEPSQPAAQGQAPAPSSASPAPLHPMAPAPPDHPLHKITGGIEALGKAIKNHASAFANPLPPQQQPDPALMAKYYRDPSEVAFERQKELWGERGQNALAVAQERTKALMASLAGRPPRLLAQTTIPDLLKQIQVDPDQVIYGPNGQEMSPAQLAEMPAGTIAREFRAGPNVFYALGDQNSKTLNVGGQIYNIPAVGPITAENATPLGIATGALSKTHEVPGMNPGEKVQLTTQPIATPGMTGGTPPQAAPATPTGDTAPAPVLKTRPQPTTPPTLPPSPSQQAIAAKTNAGRSQSRQIPTPQGQPMPPAFAKGTMLSQGRAAEPVVAAMSVVAANVFGGHGETPIWENAWMYDKPEIRKALNNALTLNALANPGTEDNPSVMQTLMTSIGATKWSQEQINDANVQARQELERVGGPEALKMFAREAALQEDLSALRTATKASAAQGSIRTLVRAAPVYNISSAQDFRNQLGTTLGTAAASMRGYPAINPKYVDWWDRGVSAAKGGPTSNNAPGIHKFATDDQGRKRPVLDPNAKLPQGWKWAD